MSHRARYPEQYTHPSVGHVATVVGPDPTASGTVGRHERGRILRVMDTQWGPLAELEGVTAEDGGFIAFRLTDLHVNNSDARNPVQIKCNRTDEEVDDA